MQSFKLEAKGAAHMANAVAAKPARKLVAVQDNLLLGTSRSAGTRGTKGAGRPHRRPAHVAGLRALCCLARPVLVEAEPLRHCILLAPTQSTHTVSTPPKQMRQLTLPPADACSRGAAPRASGAISQPSRTGTVSCSHRKS